MNRPIFRGEGEVLGLVASEELLHAVPPISSFDERRSSDRARFEIVAVEPLHMRGCEALVSRNNARAFYVEVVQPDSL